MTYVVVESINHVICLRQGFGSLPGIYFVCQLQEIVTQDSPKAYVAVSPEGGRYIILTLTLTPHATPTLNPTFNLGGGYSAQRKSAICIFCSPPTD